MKKMTSLIMAMLFLSILFAVPSRAANISDKTVKETVTVDQADAQITAAVKAKLASDKLLAQRTITVETENGIVTLKGTVKSESEKAAALSVATYVDGVKSVNSDLKVETPQDYSGPVDAAVDSAKETARETGEAIEEGADKIGDKAIDAKITAEIKLKFATDELVKARNIDVDTTNKHVTLTGTVSTTAEKDQAIKIAREVKDVVAVRSKLVVKVDHT